ncbi:hypothetical protein [Amycolatopsis sp. cg13]|uniref:hypothetical protein n=1 Tax=Amycolatopsis sp. cg13 TaxID=3238807 RepID=UPI0035237D34
MSADRSGTHTPTLSIPPQRHTSQISEESRAYWRPIVAAMDPMTSEELADVAEILRDIDARLAAQENAKPRES